MNYLVAMLCAESISKTPSLILVLSLWPSWQTEKKLISLNGRSHLFVLFCFFFFSGVGWGFKGFILFIYFLLLNVSSVAFNVEDLEREIGTSLRITSPMYYT
jgi:hypothetical protein